MDCPAWADGGSMCPASLACQTVKTSEVLAWRPAVNAKLHRTRFPANLTPVEATEPGFQPD